MLRLTLPARHWLVLILAVTAVSLRYASLWSSVGPRHHDLRAGGDATFASRHSQPASNASAGASAARTAARRSNRPARPQLAPHNELLAQLAALRKEQLAISREVLRMAAQRAEQQEAGKEVQRMVALREVLQRAASNRGRRSSPELSFQVRRRGPPRAPSPAATVAAPVARRLGKRIAVFEANQYHTEIEGFILEWCRSRGHDVTLFVNDAWSFRSFVPIYRRLFDGLRIERHTAWPAASRDFDLTVFGTAISHTHLPVAVVDAIKKLPASRIVFVLHHVDGQNDRLTSHHRRLISLTPLLATPYVTPLFTAGDEAWGPRLRLADRHRSLCMIGDGATKRYQTADIAAFVAAQAARVVPQSADGWAAAGDPPATGFFSLGAAASLPPIDAASAGGAASPSPLPPPLRLVYATDSDAGVVWEPSTLRWWWRDTAPGARHRPWHVQNCSRTSESAATVHAGGSALVARLAPALRGADLVAAREALETVLRERPTRNDAKPGPAPLTARFFNLDSPRLLQEIRRCAFVLIHPVPGARELVSRMTGALPTALMARTPLLAPRAFTELYGLTAASLTFNSSLAEVAAELDGLTDADYEALLDRLDEARVRMRRAAGALLDRLLYEPDWGGIDELGPGWNTAVGQRGGPVRLVKAERRRREALLNATRDAAAAAAAAALENVTA